MAKLIAEAAGWWSWSPSFVRNGLPSSEFELGSLPPERPFLHEWDSIC